MPVARRHSSKTSSTSASQKSILHRPATRTLAVVALEIPIDAGERNLEWNCRARPSATPARRTGRRRESDVRRSSDRGRFRSRGRTRQSAACNLQSARFDFVPTRFADPCSVRSGSTCSISGVSGAITAGKPAGRDAHRVAAELAAHAARPALRPCRRSRRTVPIPSRRPSSGRRRVDGLRTSIRGKPRGALKQRVGRNRERQGRSRRRGIPPCAVIASSVVAVPKSTTIIGRSRSLGRIARRPRSR